MDKYAKFGFYSLFIWAILMIFGNISTEEYEMAMVWVLYLFIGICWFFTQKGEEKTRNSFIELIHNQQDYIEFQREILKDQQTIINGQRAAIRKFYEKENNDN